MGRNSNRYCLGYSLRAGFVLTKTPDHCVPNFGRKGEAPLLAAHSRRWMTMRSVCVRVIALILLSAPPLVNAAEGWIPFEIYFPDPSPPCQLRTSAAQAIATLREWQAFWREAQSYQSEDLVESCKVRALPRVDFSKYTLLVLALGQRPTGGYSAVFQYAYENSSRIDVAALEVRPNGKECTTTQAVTYPVTFALIPRTKKPVQIQVKYADLQCGEPHGQ